MTNGIELIPPLLTRRLVEFPPLHLLPSVHDNTTSPSVVPAQSAHASANRRGQISPKLQWIDLMVQCVTLPSRDTVLGGRLVRDGHPHYSCNTDKEKRLMYSLNICELVVAVHI